MSAARMIATSTQIANLLGMDIYACLLATLPDAFFQMSLEAKEQAWARILSAVLQGEQDLEVLANFSINAGVCT